MLSILRHFEISTFGWIRKDSRSITFLVFLKSLEIRAMYLNYADLGIQNIDKTTFLKLFTKSNFVF